MRTPSGDASFSQVRGSNHRDLCVTSLLGFFGEPTRPWKYTIHVSAGRCHLQVVGERRTTVESACLFLCWAVVFLRSLAKRPESRCVSREWCLIQNGIVVLRQQWKIFRGVDLCGLQQRFLS